MSTTEDEDIIGRRFRGHDGVDRHVWNFRDSRVHYFTRASGSHWTPGHSFEDAPTRTMFLENCRPIGAQAPDSADGGAMQSHSPRMADLGGDF